MPAAPALAALAQSSVSTSPAGSPGAAASTRRAPAAQEHGSTPLTRAQARQRVESISPVDWLSRYGAVVVGRPDR